MEDGHGGVHFVSEKAIQAGQPLLNNYGHLSNDILMLDYGFVVAGNPYDYVSLTFNQQLLDGASIAALLPEDAFGNLNEPVNPILSQLL